MKLRSSVLLVSCLVTLAGCASVHPRVIYIGFGEAVPDQDKQVLQEYRALRQPAERALSRMSRC